MQQLHFKEYIEDESAEESHWNATYFLKTSVKEQFMLFEFKRHYEDISSGNIMWPLQRLVGMFGSFYDMK